MFCQLLLSILIRTYLCNYATLKVLATKDIGDGCPGIKFPIGNVLNLSKKSLRSCILDESSLSFWRVKHVAFVLCCRCDEYSEAVKYRANLEDLAYQQKVDLVLAGHNHHYERSWPTYDQMPIQENYVNPGGPVYVVNGGAGTYMYAKMLPHYIYAILMFVRPSRIRPCKHVTMSFCSIYVLPR